MSFWAKKAAMSKGDLQTEQLQRKPLALEAGRWRLQVISETGASSHALPKEGAVVLGRGDDADIKLDDSAASRRHAILHLGSVVRLEDLGSANGTTVRGRVLSAKETVELGAG